MKVLLILIFLCFLIYFLIYLSKTVIPKKKSLTKEEYKKWSKHDKNYKRNIIVFISLFLVSCLYPSEKQINNRKNKIELEKAIEEIESGKKDLEKENLTSNNSENQSKSEYSVLKTEDYSYSNVNRKAIRIFIDSNDKQKIEEQLKLAENNLSKYDETSIYVYNNMNSYKENQEFFVAESLKSNEKENKFKIYEDRLDPKNKDFIDVYNKYEQEMTKNGGNENEAIQTVADELNLSFDETKNKINKAVNIIY